VCVPGDSIACLAVASAEAGSILNYFFFSSFFAAPLAAPFDSIDVAVMV
jgi:hypothetical protein